MANFRCADAIALDAEQPAIDGIEAVADVRVLKGPLPGEEGHEAESEHLVGPVADEDVRCLYAAEGCDSRSHRTAGTEKGNPDGTGLGSGCGGGR